MVIIIGDFPLAEWNEISGKCFSHTPLGPGDGHVTCKGGQLFSVDRHCLTFPPTHPRVFSVVHFASEQFWISF